MVEIASTNDQFQSILQKNSKVIVKFTANWCGPCKAIALLVTSLSRENPSLKFVEVDVDKNEPVARAYNITSMPTFVSIYNSKVLDVFSGADPSKLREMVSKLSEVGAPAAQPAETSAVPLLEANLKKGMDLINDTISFSDTEILNVTDPAVRDLCSVTPSSTYKHTCSEADSQILIYLPFMNKIKIQSVLLKIPTSLDTETQRPSRIKIWPNTVGLPSFEEAASDPKAVHASEIPEPDQSGWVELKLRFVLFQNVASVSIFLDGDDEDMSTVVDTILLLGSKGEARNTGKLEKIEP